MEPNEARQNPQTIENDKPHLQNPPASKPSQPMDTGPQSGDEMASRIASGPIAQGPAHVDNTIEVVIQLGGFQSHSNGVLKLTVGRLLRNIEGVPLLMGMIATTADLIRAQVQYFPATYTQAGLDPFYIRAWWAYLRPANQPGRYIGPVVNEQQWGQMVRTISQTTLSKCRDHDIPRCPSCQGTPVVIACFDDSHLRSALISRGLAPFTQLDFVDHYGIALKELFVSCPALRQSIANMQKAVLAKPIRNLSIAPYNLPAYVGNRFIGSLTLLAPQSVGLVSGATLTAAMQITTPNQSAAPVQEESFTARLGRYHGSDALIISQVQKPLPFMNRRAAEPTPLLQLRDATPASSTGPSSASTSMRVRTPTQDERPPPLTRKRSGSGNIPSGRTKTRRLIIPDKTAPVVIPPRKYEVATERPDTWPDSKNENDVCLTCVRNGRACTGTKLHGRTGKCDRCEKGDGNRKGQRRCYWKQSWRGIFTYDDAKDADPEGRRLPANTRAGRAERARKLATRQVQGDQWQVDVDSSDSGDIVENMADETFKPTKLEEGPEKEVEDHGRQSCDEIEVEVEVDDESGNQRHEELKETTGEAVVVAVEEETDEDKAEKNPASSRIKSVNTESADTVCPIKKAVKGGAAENCECD